MCALVYTEGGFINEYAPEEDFIAARKESQKVQSQRDAAWSQGIIILSEGAIRMNDKMKRVASVKLLQVRKEALGVYSDDRARCHRVSGQSLTRSTRSITRCESPDVNFRHRN